jgi:hypothetical protein
MTASVKTTTRHHSPLREWERLVILIGALTIIWGIVLSIQYMMVGPHNVENYIGDTLTISMFWLLRNSTNPVRRMIRRGEHLER